MSISKILKLSKSSWYSCKYEMNLEIILGDGEVIKLQNSQIVGMYLEKDYDNDHLPILRIDLAIGRLVRNKIDDDTVFHLKVTQFYLENNDTDSEKKERKVFIDEKFTRIDFGTPPDTNEDLERKVRESNGMSDYEVAPHDLTSQETFVLVKKRDLSFTKKLVNGVLANVTMEEAVRWSLVNAKCQNNILMSNFTNTERHNELLLPTKPLLEQLIYMEQEYGWHTEGTYIFVDFDTFYIIRKNGKSTAWKKNEPTSVSFCIVGSLSKDSGSEGIIRQNSNIYVNVGSEQYKLVDASIVGDQIDGTNLILFNTSNGTYTKLETGTNSIDGGAYTSKMYHGHNPYVTKQFNRMKHENDHIWELSCKNIDISQFTPNKQYTFLSDVTKINKTLSGFYRISSIKTSFVKNGDYFDTTSTVRVKRSQKA